jgi:carbamoyltransferase
VIKWGISSNSHNAALSIFQDDCLVFASSSERFSKIKNDPHINRCLVDYALSFGEPNQIYWYESPRLKTLRQIFSGQGYCLNENNIPKYIFDKTSLKVPIKYSNHHRSHAAAGYYTSPFTDATVIVLDAIGEFDTFTIWEGKGKELKKLYSHLYPSSLGLWYSAMTQRCGLKPNEEEYILMGMSAFGDPSRLFSDILEDFIDLSEEDPFKIKYNLHRGCRWWRPDLNSQRDIFDIAAATQSVYEFLFERVLIKSLSISRNKNLVLMGGCALNCVANSICYKYFDNVWIMPAPGDDGSSIGSVLSHSKKHIEWSGPYLGFDLGYKSSNHEIVNHLIENKICGIARGRAEFGPRSLGNRSLIADPRGDDIKNLVNSIKKRESFRPFAPVILEEMANQYFEMPTNKTPYMQFTAKCKRPDLYPAIVHLDNTSRVQTLSKKNNPQFRELLEIWYEKTGCPMILNTSLNIKGEPIINDINQVYTWEEIHQIKIWT